MIEYGVCPRCNNKEKYSRTIRKLKHMYSFGEDMGLLCKECRIDIAAKAIKKKPKSI